MENLVVLEAQGNLLSVPPNYQAGADILAVVQQGSTPVSSLLTPSGLCLNLVVFGRSFLTTPPTASCLKLYSAPAYCFLSPFLSLSSTINSAWHIVGAH